MALRGASTTGEVASTGDPFRDERIAWSNAIDANRDQWGRPKIMLPDGKSETGYRRASGYGSPLESSYRLELWKLRQVSRGVARSRALRLEVTREETGLDSDNADEAKAARNSLDKIAERAMDLVGSGDAASEGTSMHHVHERVDRGLDPGHVPEEFRADVKAWRELTRSLRMVSIERFVVQDDHRVAGTLDRAAEVLEPLVLPDGTVLEVGDVVIVDEKTSQSLDFAGVKFGVQCWVYATGQPYDPVKKVRVPWGHKAPRTDVALIAHVPSGQGTAALYAVNLLEAAEAARCVREVHEWRNSRGKKIIGKASTHDEQLAGWSATVAACETRDELMALAKQATTQGFWSDSLRAVFSARKAELGPVLEVVGA